MEYLKQAWSELQFCAEQYLPASPSQSQGRGVEQARVGADTTAFVCLCLQGYVCVCWWGEVKGVGGREGCVCVVGEG